MAKRPEIDKLLMDKLSDALTFDQKVRKIGKLLTSLRMSGRIEIGEKRGAKVPLFAEYPKQPS